MSDESVNTISELDPDESDIRQRSSIGFPYNNLDDAIAVTVAIHSNVGTGECDDAQLSAWMGLSPKSSGFRMQVSAARMFGVVETNSGHHKLTALGRTAVDPRRQREARAKAFLNVPLYKALFENFRTGVLPPAAALEREMLRLGVAEKQTGRARQVFERSAEQGGFFEHGKNRLVMPGIAGQDAPTLDKPNDPNDPDREKFDRDQGGAGSGSGGNGGIDLDPLLIALLKKIPPTKDGWPLAKRVRWFRTFAMNVSQIYDSDDDPVELDIKAATASE
jgi:hypothetical protein